MNPSTKDLIAHYGLLPHPEGGYFQETYRSKESVAANALPARFGGERSVCTGICFLLPKGAKSRLHRLKSDEMWHFYLGGPLEVTQISPDGKVETTVLGPEIADGQKVQHVVPAGYWFGAMPAKGAAYSFVGCTVAPGFDFSDFEIGKRKDLLKTFPKAKAAIERLTDPR